MKFSGRGLAHKYPPWSLPSSLYWSPLLSVYVRACLLKSHSHPHGTDSGRQPSFLEVRLFFLLRALGEYGSHLV